MTGTNHRQAPLDDHPVADPDTPTSPITAALRTDMDSMHRGLEAIAQADVWASARITLSDLASCSLDDRIADAFRRRLRELDPEAKNGFLRCVGEGSDSTNLATAFDLSESPRSEIQQIFEEEFSTGIRLRFETRPELIGGFELSTNGQKLTWSLSAYLDSLERNLRELDECGRGRSPRPENPTDSVTNATEERKP